MYNREDGAAEMSICFSLTSRSEELSSFRLRMIQMKGKWSEITQMTITSDKEEDGRELVKPSETETNHSDFTFVNIIPTD